jgi:hypothetical protein
VTGDPSVPHNTLIVNAAAINSAEVLEPHTPSAPITVRDIAPPSVELVSPAHDAVDIPVGAPVVITFSEAIEIGSFANNVLPDPGVSAQSWDPDSAIAGLAHTDFDNVTGYTVTVTAADDLGGNPMTDAPYAW